MTAASPSTPSPPPPAPAAGSPGAGIDYTIYYKLWHDDSPESARRTVDFAKAELGPVLPARPSAGDGPALDVGCGDGHAMVALGELGYPEVRGVEIDAGQAEATRRRGLDVDLTDDTIAYLHARPGRFGLITLLDVLEHVPVPAQIPMMRAVFAALRPGGRVVLRVPNATSPVFARWLYQDHTHHCSFTEMSVYFILANAGFAGVRTPPSPPPGFPPLLRLRPGYRLHLRRWLVRWWWRQVLLAEAPFLKPDTLNLDLNLITVAFRPGPGAPGGGPGA